MIALRRLALGVLWLLAAVGIACGLVWGATAAGLIKPLIVISGSMEPHIMTGDLLVDRPVSTGTLRPGDVVSLPSTLTHDLVTHRIQTVSAEGDGTYTITLKGDNNTFADALPYRVGAQVWMPQMQLPGVGAALQRLAAPGVVIAFLAGLAGLLGLVWLIPAPGRTRDDRESAADTVHADHRRETGLATVGAP
ncbi:MAG TPA: signal peptidase I [Microbacterium sp.]|uniref:signal peptidase I n=1 Tax=Microbacterium sp. TaxID=51671 RepID=UPI002B49E086|nr:signal peptidase I [Microbacterium sp.]HKT57527.1 signal peptidase I [Microbacterium sp.]